MRSHRLALSLLLVLPLLAGAAHASDTPRRVLRRIPIGGEGGWDYLTADRDRHRLFVAHGTEVDVVDLARDSLVGRISDTPGVHGVAEPPARQWFERMWRSH